jgi:hypothetical protein
MEMIRREAARYGVHIVNSEVIGLIPQAALTDAAQWYLQLDGLRTGQMLEHQLALLEQPPSAAASSTAFLDALAAGTATPGGGAAAAYDHNRSYCLSKLSHSPFHHIEGHAGTDPKQSRVLQATSQAGTHALPTDDPGTD